jgi:hypothetical protein
MLKDRSIVDQIAKKAASLSKAVDEKRATVEKLMAEAKFGKYYETKEELFEHLNEFPPDTSFIHNKFGWTALPMAGYLSQSYNADDVDEFSDRMQRYYKEFQEYQEAQRREKHEAQMANFNDPNWTIDTMCDIIAKSKHFGKFVEGIKKNYEPLKNNYTGPIDRFTLLDIYPCESFLASNDTCLYERYNKPHNRYDQSPHSPCGDNIPTYFDTPYNYAKYLPNYLDMKNTGYNLLKIERNGMYRLNARIEFGNLSNFFKDIDWAPFSICKDNMPGLTPENMGMENIVGLRKMDVNAEIVSMFGRSWNMKGPWGEHLVLIEADNAKSLEKGMRLLDQYLDTIDSFKAKLEKTKKQWDEIADKYDAVLKEYMKQLNELKAKNEDLTNWTEKMVNKLRKQGEIITAPFDGVDKETDYETF